MKTDILFKNYTDDDYEALCEFLIVLNANNDSHINWNWARLEWMIEHPEFDKSLKNSIGLWTVDDKIVGAAIYDMYFGEGFCGVLLEHKDLYPDVVKYACRELKDDSGFGLAICDENADEVKSIRDLGFTIADQDETIMEKSLDDDLSAELPTGLKFFCPDPVEDVYDLEWLFWQGFDHGDDKAEFEREEEIIPRVRKHFNKDLGVAAVNENGEMVACCLLWYMPGTDYVYVEPVCTIPSYRGKGVAKALIFEALRRAKKLGANRAYVISNMEFYEKLGFRKKHHYTFYWKD
ncbi:Acetyltransferase (GNAT) domain-containing protein [Butyrivibrio fibrisolvens DSM 3071]|uniref:Acetyltransferase (GNAT) domain-containing protein n=1 Tax=Butyrivibrio fibrisolvens DSM 3071 TaxID=1121131 RepID=A0A1M5WKH2_BUTFI|nr:GNAT family N-acetyltransferase [Butyrivibrio fibrisolvens]SHH87603.1 Acetyltransferase (GNAT) domain-containing protein [Butyrivibrio fibrisolvens DSM 3071]